MKAFNQFSKALLLIRCDMYAEQIEDLKKFAMEFEDLQDLIEITDTIALLHTKLEKLRDE